MSEQTDQPFRNRDEELAHLGRQLGEIKDALRERAAERPTISP